MFSYKAWGFLLAGTGGGALARVREEGIEEVREEREVPPEEREGVLEEIEGAREGGGGVGMVVPRCSFAVRGRVGGGTLITSPVTPANLVSKQEGGCGSDGLELLRGAGLPMVRELENTDIA